MMESRDLISVSRHISRAVLSSLGLEDLRFRLGLELLVSRLSMSHFLCEVLQQAAPSKTGLQSNCSKLSRSKWLVVKLSLLWCCGENNLPSTLFKICAEFNKNSVCTSETAAHNFCNACKETLGVALYFAKDYLSTVFASSFVMKTHIQKKWESANKFFLWEAKQNEVFSSKFFSKQSVKTRDAGTSVRQRGQ